MRPATSGPVIQERPRWALAVALAVLSLGCPSEAEKVCGIYARYCATEANVELCQKAVKASAPEVVEKSRACLAKAGSCGEAAACLPPPPGTGWTDYAPLAK